MPAVGATTAPASFERIPAKAASTAIARDVFDCMGWRPVAGVDEMEEPDGLYSTRWAAVGAIYTAITVRRITVDSPRCGEVLREYYEREPLNCYGSPEGPGAVFT